MTCSIGQMIAKLAGMVGTDDLSEWESEFVSSVSAQSANGNATQRLTAKQIEKVSQVYGRHFGDASVA